MPAAYRAVLFDLDGTLLDNNMYEFLPHYFKLLSARAARLAPPDEFMPALMGGSEAMMRNDGRAANEEVFAAAFFPRLGRPVEEWQALFAAFYAEDFPKLRPYTRRKPAARLAVQTAFEQGYQVVIAPTPLFPATAVQQRLEWAGVADFAYDLVTSYENSRACKPNLLYFEHILAHLGRRAEECLVVGDENMDMVAAKLGCATFLVPGPTTELEPDTPPPTYRGDLTAVGALLRGEWPPTV